MKHIYLSIFFLCSFIFAKAQSAAINGTVVSDDGPVSFASIILDGSKGTTSDSLGNFHIGGLQAGKHRLMVSSVGLGSQQQIVNLRDHEIYELNIHLTSGNHALEEIVITGTTGNTIIREFPIAIQKVSEKQLTATSAEMSSICW